MSLLNFQFKEVFVDTLILTDQQESPDYLKELIRKTRSLTKKSFGVGVVLAFPHEKNIQVVLDAMVAVLQVYWGECSEELALKAHRSGVKIVPQAGSLDEAEKEMLVQTQLLFKCRAPHRVLHIPFFNDCKSIPADQNEAGQHCHRRSIIHDREIEICRLGSTVPNATTTGDIESMVMYGGQSVGLIKENLPAGEVEKRLVEGAELLIKNKFSDMLL
ncbi:hypothetical protein FF1_002765 [Malus domestica]